MKKIALFLAYMASGAFAQGRLSACNPVIYVDPFNFYDEVSHISPRTMVCFRGPSNLVKEDTTITARVIVFDGAARHEVFSAEHPLSSTLIPDSATPGKFFGVFKGCINMGEVKHPCQENGMGELSINAGGICAVMSVKLGCSS